MKCALELLATCEEKRKEQKALKKIQDAERLDKLVKAIRNDTIEYCNLIAKGLEELANCGKTPVFTFKTSEYYSNTPRIDYLLVVTYRDYADKRESYKKGILLDLDYIKEWLTKYCFIMEVHEFPHYRYGEGMRIGKEFQIKPDPNCL